MKQNGKKSMLLKVVGNMGKRSVNQACMLWMNQPKVPASMMKKENEKK